MSTPRIIALGNARLGSTRCPGKMLRPFSGTTLAELALERLDALGRLSALEGFDGVYFAAYEPELMELVARYPRVTLIKRSHESATVCNPITTVHEYLRDIDCDYVFWVNSCLAMLKPETVIAALHQFRSHPQARSMTAVVRSNNWFYTPDGQAVNNTDPRCIDTKRTPPLLEVCHAFHGFSKKHFFATGSYWNNAPLDPYLYEIDPAEAVDVDTELDFVVAESVYENQRGAVAV